MTAEGAEIVEDLHEVAPLQNPTKETNVSIRFDGEYYVRGYQVALFLPSYITV